MRISYKLCEYGGADHTLRVMTFFEGQRLKSGTVEHGSPYIMRLATG
jgi:hypothetical protein